MWRSSSRMVGSSCVPVSCTDFAAASRRSKVRVEMAAVSVLPLHDNGVPQSSLATPLHVVEKVKEGRVLGESVPAGY